MKSSMLPLLLILATSTTLAQGQSLVSGGVGFDEMAKIQSVAGQYNVKAIFALKSGKYLADIPVTVTDAKGATVIDTVAVGPWLLAKLAPGTYRIAATFDGRTLTIPVAVPATGNREVVFRWERDVAEAGEPLEPAPEGAPVKPLRKSRAR